VAHNRKITCGAWDVSGGMIAAENRRFEIIFLELIQNEKTAMVRWRLGCSRIDYSLAAG
jgi:hypothetical protein